MKKLLITFLILAGFTAASSAEASFFIFKQNVIAVQAGKTFTLPVIVDGNGTSQYTVRFSIAFPPDLLEVTSFAFGDKWIALSQPGYDSIDNKIGELIKTGGFPRGFSGPVTLGTITFRAKGPGQSTIIVGAQSLVLDAQNNNTLESRPKILVNAAGELVPEAPFAPEAPFIQTPPSLPSTGTGENISDVNLTSIQKISSPPAAFFILLLIVAVLLGLIGRAVFIGLKHRSIRRKKMHVEDN